MSLKGIKLVTFDITNTLLQFRRPPWQHYAAVARDHGYKGTDSDVKTNFINSYGSMMLQYPNFGRNKISWQDWWNRVVKMTFKGQLPVGTDVDCIADTLIEDFKTSKCWMKAKGGERLLQLLEENQISIGIISNTDPRLHDVLHNISCLNQFEFVLTSYETGYSKPDKRIFEYAINKCVRPVEPQESLHIGDNLHKDYEGARAAGWHAVLICGNLKTERPPASEHVFINLENLTLAIENNTLKL